MRPIFNKNILVFDAEPADADQTSVAIDVRESKKFSVQVDWSGGTGTTASIIVQATNYNVDEAGSAGAVWSPLEPDTGSGSDSVAADAGNTLLRFSSIEYGFVRVLWDQSAGTGGTVNSIVCVKS